MAFGKKRIREERSIEEEDFSSMNVKSRSPNIEILDDEDEEEESNAQNGGDLSRASKSTTQAHHSQMQEVKPLYDEVILTGVAPGKNPGGAKNWICKHCNTQYSSSYTRIHAHFFGGLAGKNPNVKRCPAILANRSELERIRKRVQEAEKAGISSSLKSSKLTKRFNSETNPIENSFRAMDRDMVDLKVIRGLCANGISFNVLRNPQFHEMVSAINSGPQGYKAPSFEKARTTLLDKCKTGVERDLIPIKETWYTHGVTIVSDGWTNVKHQQLINIIAVNSCGAMFLYAEDFTGKEKTGRVIADFLLKAIEEVGPSNVLQVVTDNAANCKLAGKEVEKVHTHIFWSPCVVHTLNLIFKDFANKFEWFRDTYQRGKTIVKYFINHTHALAMFRAQSKLELLKVAKTIFASHYILLKRLADCREALATTVILKNWKDWVKTGDEHIRTMGSLVGDTIKSDEFWDDVNHIITITKPLIIIKS